MACLSSLSARFDRLAQRNKLIILVFLGAFTIASILIGQFGPKYLRLFRYIGYAMAIPSVLVIVSYRRTRRANQNAAQATIYTTQQYTLPPGQSDVPPPYIYTTAPTGPGQPPHYAYETFNDTHPFPVQQQVNPYNVPTRAQPNGSGSTDSSATVHAQPPPLYNALPYPNQQSNVLPAPPSYDEAMASKRDP